MEITGQKIIGTGRINNEFSFFTDNGAELIVSYISEKTVRIAVRFDKNEKFDKSYAIEEIHYKNVDASLDETADCYVINSTGISVKIYKANSKIEYIKNDSIITSATWTDGELPVNL